MRRYRLWRTSRVTSRATAEAMRLAITLPAMHISEQRNISPPHMKIGPMRPCGTTLSII